MARRDTRNLILTTSLALFNEYGEPNVTTNQIADEADISPGNLYYHFRKRDEITLELFKGFLLQIQPLIEVRDGPPPAIEDLWLRLHLMFETMGRFRFLYRNLTDLYRRIPQLRHAVNGLLARQREGIQELLRGLRSSRAMRLSDDDIGPLIDAVLILTNYWISFAEIEGDPGLEDGSTLPRAVARTLHLFVPYLGEEEGRHLARLAKSYLAS